ncbi:MAG: hypothetical protein MPJ22_01330, partial [Pirellulales bacterium]|nr:hypothetical protein [Pirellulales bacterium]
GLASRYEISLKFQSLTGTTFSCIGRDLGRGLKFVLIFCGFRALRTRHRGGGGCPRGREAGIQL